MDYAVTRNELLESHCSGPSLSRDGCSISSTQRGIAEMAVEACFFGNMRALQTCLLGWYAKEIPSA